MGIAGITPPPAYRLGGMDLIASRPTASQTKVLLSYGKIWPLTLRYTSV